MRGRALRVVQDGNRNVLFTDGAVWEATPRRDANAFDFNEIDPITGLAGPLAVTKTPQGVFFLSQDLRLYRLAARQLIRIGRRVESFWKPDITSDFYERTSDQDEEIPTARISLNYNQKDNELWVGYDFNGGISGPVQIMDTVLALRLDTLQTTAEGEQDGVWSMYTFPVSVGPDTANYLPTSTVLGPRHVVAPQSTEAEVARWTDHWQYDHWGTSSGPSEASSNITGQWLGAQLLTSKDPKATQAVVGAWAYTKGFATSSDTTGNLALYVANAQDVSKDTLDFPTSALTDVALHTNTLNSQNLKYIPTTSDTFQEGFLAFEMTGDRYVLQRLDYEMRPYSGRFLP